MWRAQTGAFKIKSKIVQIMKYLQIAFFVALSLFGAGGTFYAVLILFGFAH